MALTSKAHARVATSIRTGKALPNLFKLHSSIVQVSYQPATIATSIQLLQTHGCSNFVDLASVHTLTLSLVFHKQGSGEAAPSHTKPTAQTLPCTFPGWLGVRCFCPIERVIIE